MGFVLSVIYPRVDLKVRHKAKYSCVYHYFQVKNRNISLETLSVKKAQLYFLPLRGKDESLNIDALQNSVYKSEMSFFKISLVIHDLCYTSIGKKWRILHVSAIFVKDIYWEQLEIFSVRYNY